jgi:hypothetical protein
MNKAKYAFLLLDGDVKRWYRNLARGSKVTADVSLRRLGLFCLKKGIKPRQLIELGEEKATRLILDTVDELEAKGYANSYIESMLKALKSWLKFNNMALTIEIKINDAEDSPTLANERTPTQEELARIFRACKLDARAAVALMAFSGLRPQVLGNYDGSDGLRLSDLLEAKIDNEKGLMEFTRIPTLIRVRKPLSKAGHQYFTFLCEEGCRYIKEYLENRMHKGEKLTAESAVITAKHAKKQFIRTVNIGDKIRAGIRAAGFPWRPYVLRCYFETQMMIAESKGLIIRDYRTYWMGHKGDIEARYSTNKGVLPMHVIEDMREAYRKAQKYLQTEALNEGEDLKLEFRRQLLYIVGYSKEEVEAMHIEELNDQMLQAKLKEKLLMVNGNGDKNDDKKVKQKVIRLDEVEAYIESGWEYVAQLPNGKAIVRLIG